MSEPRYLVVGNPIAHSRSPEIHAHFAAQFSISMSYERALVAVDGFADFVTQFAQAGGRGLNVTLPFKRDAHDFVDNLDPLARDAQAVNTIALDAEQGSRGFNTDGGGLIRDLKIRHHQEIAGASVVMFGAGGAAQGVLAALIAERPAAIWIANRTVEKAAALVQRARTNASVTSLYACSLGARAGATGVRDKANEPVFVGDARPDLVINATSFGHHAQESRQDEAERVERELGVSAQWLDGAFCYDMTYGSGALFHRWAQRANPGASVDGLGMLVEQAALSFNIWHGVQPQTDELLAKMRDAT